MPGIGSSLKDAVRSAILGEIKRKNVPFGAVLVADPWANTILLDCNCLLNDLLDLGIREKLNLFGKRNEMRATCAVYFVAPERQSLLKMIDDARQQLYAAAYVFLTTENDEFYKNFSESVPKSFVEAFVELNIQFTPLESRVFHINQPDALHELYAQNSVVELEAHLIAYAKKFRNVLTTMNLDPIIKYHNPIDSYTSLSSRMAHFLSHELAEFKSELNSEYPQATPYDHLGPATVVIVDRAIDLFSPLVHSLSYQAVAHDMFNVEDVVSAQGTKNIVFKIEGGGKEDVILDETSPLFNTLRHLFISQAIEETQKSLQELREFINPTATTTDELRMKTSLLDVKQAQKRQLESVIDFLEELMQKIKVERNLIPVADIEQDLTTGKKLDGTVNSRKKTFEKLKGLFSDGLLEDQDRWRLMLLTAIAFGQINDPDFQAVLQSANLDPTEHIIFTGLKYFGFDPAASSARHNNTSSTATTNTTTNSWNITALFGSSISTKTDVTSTNEYAAFDRYQPAVTSILLDQLNGRLDSKVFRTCKLTLPKDINQKSQNYGKTIRRKDLEENSQGNQDSNKIGEGIIIDFNSGFVPKWGRMRPKPFGDTGNDYRSKGPVTVLIVLGGLTYAEVRSAYLTAISEEREVFIGSTHMISAIDFIDSLFYFGSLGKEPLNLENEPGNNAQPISPSVPRPLTGNETTQSNIELISDSLAAANLTASHGISSSTPNLSTFSGLEFGSTDSLPASSKQMEPTGFIIPENSNILQVVDSNVNTANLSSFSVKQVEPAPQPPSKSTADFTTAKYIPMSASVISDNEKPVPPPPVANLKPGSYSGYTHPTPSGDKSQESYKPPASLEELAHVAAMNRLAARDAPLPPNDGGAITFEGFSPVIRSTSNSVTQSPRPEIIQTVTPSASTDDSSLSANAKVSAATTPGYTFTPPTAEYLRKESSNSGFPYQQNPQPPVATTVVEIGAPAAYRMGSLNQQPGYTSVPASTRSATGAGYLYNSLPVDSASVQLQQRSQNPQPESSSLPAQAAPASARVPSPTRSTISGHSGSVVREVTVDHLATYSSLGMSMEEQISQVLAMCPDYSRQVIAEDLKDSKSVEITLERIFTGELPITGRTYLHQPPRNNLASRHDSTASSVSGHTGYPTAQQTQQLQPPQQLPNYTRAPSPVSSSRSNNSGSVGLMRENSAGSATTFPAAATTISVPGSGGYNETNSGGGMGNAQASRRPQSVNYSASTYAQQQYGQGISGYAAPYGYGYAQQQYYTGATGQVPLLSPEGQMYQYAATYQQQAPRPYQQTQQQPQLQLQQQQQQQYYYQGQYSPSSVPQQMQGQRYSMAPQQSQGYFARNSQQQYSPQSQLQGQQQQLQQQQQRPYQTPFQSQQPQLSPGGGPLEQTNNSLFIHESDIGARRQSAPTAVEVSRLNATQNQNTYQQRGVAMRVSTVGVDGVVDPVPTWDGPWPLVLTSHQNQYQKVRKAYIEGLRR